MEPAITDEQDVASRIRDVAALILRKEHPHMKTQRLDEMLEAMTIGLRDSIKKQQQELRDTRARANFFILPIALRLVIYEFVLMAPFPLDIRKKTREDKDEAKFHLSLLRVSRQVNQKALPVFWAVNKFAMRFWCINPHIIRATLHLEPLRSLNIPRDHDGSDMMKHLTIELGLLNGNGPFSSRRMLLRLPVSSIDEFAGKICQLTSTTPEELGSKLNAEEWNKDIILQATPLADLGIRKSAVQLKVVEG